MHIWQSLRFSARALSMQAVAHAPSAYIEAKRQKRLARLLRHARQHSRYLADKYAGLDTDTVSLTDLPTTSKAEVMSHFDDWLTVDDVTQSDVERFCGDDANLGTLFRDRYVLSHTSGSEGQPLLLVKSPAEFQLMFALQASRGNRNGLGFGELVAKFKEPARLAAITMQPGFYPSSSAFDYLPKGAQPYIDTRQFSLSDPDLLDRLQQFQPTHLTAYSSILQEMVRRIESGQLRLESLHQAVNIAERLLPNQRQYCERVLGAPILDNYGMGECLFLTNGCPAGSGMHLNADWAILEVVDEHHRPVPEGTAGAKVLMTNLANRIQPLIRYEVGDAVVMATEPCGCGSKLPLISHIEGRSGNVVRTEIDGKMRLLHPAIIEDVINHDPDIREFQVVIELPRGIALRLEPIPGGRIDLDAIERRLRQQLDEHGFRNAFQLDVTTAERLSPDPDEGKFKRVVIREPVDNANSSLDDSPLAM